MPQRNAKNPIKSARDFEPKGKTSDNVLNVQAKSAVAGVCPACKAEVPLKPGFRFSALKCPKCGASMGKKVPGKPWNAGDATGFKK